MPIGGSSPTAPTDSPDTAALRERLADIDQDFIPPGPLQAARERIARSRLAGSEAFVQAALDESFHNPILGAITGIEAWEAAQRLNDQAQQTLAALALGSALVWWGYHQEALPFLEYALAALEPGDQPPLLSLYARWQLLLCERRLREVPDAFAQLLAIADELAGLGDEYRAMRCRSDASQGMLPSSSHAAAAQLWLAAASAYFMEHGHPGDWALSQVALADFHFSQGEFESGLALLDGAEEAFAAGDMPTLLVYSWVIRGMYIHHLRRFDEALEWLLRAEERARSLRHDRYRALALLEIAYLYFEQGDVRLSLDACEAVAPLAARLGLAFVSGKNELLAANIQLRRGEYRLAEEGYRRARQIFDGAGQDVFATTCTLNLGIVARRQGRFARSLEQIRRALLVFEANRAYDHLANAHHNLGKTYAAFSYYEPAIEHFRRGITILEEAGVPAQAVRPRIYLARLLIGRGELDQARALLAAARVQARVSGLELDAAVGLRTQADLLLREGRAGEALNAYRRSLDDFRRLGQEEAAWESRLGIAEAHLAAGEDEQAAQALAALDHEGLPAASGWHYHLIAARLARRQGRLADAMHAYLSALAQVRVLRRGLADEDQAEHFALALQLVYDEAFELAVTLDGPEDALLIAELFGAQLISARLGFQAAGPEAVRGLPERTAAALNRHLGEGWTALRYAWHQERLWLFVLSPESLARHLLDLDRQARMALQVCASPDDSYRTFAYLGRSARQKNAAVMAGRSRRILYRALLPAAVRARLSPDHTLIVIPSGELYGLPFQALLDDDDTPLIMQARVLYARSLDLLADQLQAGEPPPLAGPGLVLAQSEFARPDYEPLPYVVGESQAILAARPGELKHLKPTPSAWEAVIREQGEEPFGQYGWLHIATHAYADGETGAFAGLLLGAGIVRLEDIQGWRLKASLVTLSACQTGMGRWHYGDEIAGLLESFLGAGARAVVVSLWLVNDEETADFMRAFYTHLGRSVRPLAALAEAQREAFRSGVEPYYWAAFSFFGQP
jgi:CHAT domain-containing protein/tetratricopeptide (TPR) repeat protein